MPQENKLVGGEREFTWRGRRTQLGGLVAAMTKDLRDYQSALVQAANITLQGHGKPDLIFARKVDPAEPLHSIVADQPTIEEDFV